MITKTRSKYYCKKCKYNHYFDTKIGQKNINLLKYDPLWDNKSQIDARIYEDLNDQFKCNHRKIQQALKTNNNDFFELLSDKLSDYNFNENDYE